MKLYRILVTGVVAVLLSLSCSEKASKDQEPILTDTTPAGEYKLVWADEFDGATLDLTKWNYEIDGYGGGNGELQYYTDSPKNLYLKDGLLIIEAIKELKDGREYTSARITTKGKAEFTYCKIECRLSVPEGRGTWPAFWMLGADWPGARWPYCGEIDIMEHVGYDAKMFSHALHTQNKNAGSGWTSKKWFPTSVQNKFYVFTLERIPATGDKASMIKFFIDGEEIGYSDQRSENLADWPFNKDFFMILNLAIGGSWGGAQGVDDKIFDSPVQFKVDYVRVYQRK